MFHVLDKMASTRTRIFLGLGRTISIELNFIIIIIFIELFRKVEADENEMEWNN